MTNCPICNTGAESFTDRRGCCVFFECHSCGLIFRAKKDILSPEQEKARYDLHRNSLEDEGYVSYLKKFVDNAVMPFAPATKKGLDYGAARSRCWPACLNGITAIKWIFTTPSMPPARFMKKINTA